MLTKISNHLRDTLREKLRVSIIIFVFLSLIFLITILIGSINGSVFLSKFTFSKPINEILRRNSITFTLLGYCIDDSCTHQLSHNFDKGNLHLFYNSFIWNNIIVFYLAPTSKEIQSGQIQNQKRAININPKNASDSIGNTIGSTVQNAGKTIGGTVQNAGKTIGNTVQNALLSAFDNFVPKEPTNGKSGWIARSIIVALIFNSIALIILLTTKNKIYCYSLTFPLILISFIFNLVSFIITFSLFSLVFNVIAAFSGIGSNQKQKNIILHQSNQITNAYYIINIVLMEMTPMYYILM